MDNKVIDVPAESEPSQALTVRDAVQAVERAAAPEKPAITAAQAKIEAIADLTKSAYARASELKLTPEESAALQEDFPDEAFKQGAAGKADLLYIEHAFLRDRLNKVFGIGQWAVIPRNRWAEPYKTYNGKDAERIYCEAMLLVRGCFVSESVGEMSYFKHNDAQNYADAVEGAKTAALRRCCKELGVGLQAWKKDWCAGWWARHNAGQGKPPAPAQRIEHPRNQAASKPAPAQQQTRAAAPEGEQVYPVCDVLMVAEKSGVKKTVDPKTGLQKDKPWTVWFIKFDDGITNSLEGGTFDSDIASLANELCNGRVKARIVTKPGRKEGSREIVSLERADGGYTAPPPPDGDTVPMDFDAQGNPIPLGVTP